MAVGACMGHLQKMMTVYDTPVRYQLHLDETIVELNPLLQQTLSLTFLGEIACIHCGRVTKTSFQQGYCYPCFRELQQCNLCLIHPERCQVETGTCPSDHWAHAQCHAEHIVYLANSSGLKVGITRHIKEPTRWIDQGASQALPIYRTANRYLAGLVEVCLKQYVADRTQWRTMLKQAVSPIDLVAAKSDLLKQAQTELTTLIQNKPSGAIESVNSASVLQIEYPVAVYPKKIVSLSFDKTPTIQGTLLGIKGQYLIFDRGVLNIRKFGGYQVSCEY